MNFFKQLWESMRPALVQPDPHAVEPCPCCNDGVPRRRLVVRTDWTQRDGEPVEATWEFRFRERVPGELWLSPN